MYIITRLSCQQHNLLKKETKENNLYNLISYNSPYKLRYDPY